MSNGDLNRGKGRAGSGQTHLSGRFTGGMGGVRSQRKHDKQINLKGRKRRSPGYPTPGLPNAKISPRSIAYRIKSQNQYSHFQHKTNDFLAAHFKLNSSYEKY
jgi:hypothetical protein